MTSPRFALDEIVFAKLKGWPPWPAKVEFLENIPSSSSNNNKVKYNVYFYGTNQIALCREEDLYSYKENRDKFGRKKLSKKFMTAISQADEEFQRNGHSLTTTVKSKEEPSLPSLDYLKSELKTLKIDHELKDCLNLNKPRFGTCLRLLEEYSMSNLNPLTFIKHPELIDTLLKLQVYSRDVNFASEKLKDSVKWKVHQIRVLASNIYLKVQSAFNVPQGREFLEVFVEKLTEFNESVKHMTENEILQLSKDPALT